MRFSHFKWKLRLFIEKQTINLVWKLPRSLVYWCAIRVIAEATTGKYGSAITGELKAIDALERWGKK